MNEYTPIMQQYLEIKAKHKDMILFFRVGDFYELFFDDCIEVYQLLSLTLTSKGKHNGVPIPMAGFPVKSANGYIAKLMRLNKKVAICEQVSGLKKNGLIERKVVRIFTPGTFFNDNYLNEDDNNFIVCIANLDNKYGISALDVSTGYFFISIADNKFDLINEIDKINPIEILVSNSDNFLFSLFKKFFINKLDDKKFDYNSSHAILNKFFGTQGMSHINLDFFKSSIVAAGCLLDFVLCTQNNKLENVIFLEVNGINSFLYLDHNSRKNLEVFKSLSGNDKDSIFHVIDRTSTSMGKRLLRRWLVSPVLSRSILNDRFLGVSTLKFNQSYLKIKPLLLQVCDLERILSKVVFSIVKPCDLKKLRNSLAILPLIKSELEKLNFSGILEVICLNMRTFKDIIELIDKSIVDDYTGNISEGGFIKPCFDSKLDKYRALSKSTNDYLIEYRGQEGVRLNIPNLLIEFFPKFGYLMEVSKASSIKVDSSYKKVASTHRVDRYINDKLKNLDKEIDDIKNLSLDREKRLYRAILYKIRKKILCMQVTAKYISILDVITSFAIQSSLCDWCEPFLVDDIVVDIKSGRHPVVEFNNSNVFVPNDLFLDLKVKGLIITGANMGGKSTYMRQAAIIILLSHIGSHVPATSAKIGKIDKIFTRIGAGDDLANSYSTFMLEMKEMADILKKATDSSFVLIDELGRGTGYFEGKALAFSIIMDLVEVNRAFFLFSTHFYDLHIICDIYSVIDKIYFVVFNNDDVLDFCYKFKKGFSDSSFGIDVASMAGLPENVISNAFLKLKDFKKSFFLSDNGLCCKNCLKFTDLVKDLDPDSLSPKEALDKIYLLKEFFDKD